MEGRLSGPAIWIVNTISDDGLPVSQTASQPFGSWATKLHRSNCDEPTERVDAFARVRRRVKPTAAPKESDGA
jgi:hypothetical protein